jgi:hypothetical protein
MWQFPLQYAGLAIFIFSFQITPSSFFIFQKYIKHNFPIKQQFSLAVSNFKWIHLFMCSVFQVSNSYNNPNFSQLLCITGSAWTILSRSFAEYSIVGWDNLPRTLLLYYTNFVSSPEGYFQTVICNSEDYKNTTVNHDLHYITWDTPPKQHPRSLGVKDYRRMILSSRPFARKFKRNDPVLDKIDRELLKRYKGQFAHGGWCARSGKRHGTCSGLQNENYGVLRPGPGSRRLQNLLTKLLSEKNFKRQCR